MDAPPIRCLVDRVHAFNGLAMKQFKKNLEKLLSDSILLWRLLKLLFKILRKSCPTTQSIFATESKFWLKISRLHCLFCVTGWISETFNSVTSFFSLRIRQFPTLDEKFRNRRVSQLDSCVNNTHYTRRKKYKQKTLLVLGKILSKKLGFQALNFWTSNNFSH